MVHPGPITDDLLYFGATHRARQVFHGVEPYLSEQLYVRRCDCSLDVLNTLSWTEEVELIRLAGFHGVLGSRGIHVDHSLVTALVERWRPETHTFHLPIGEATVTMQDVAVLWGLPVDGRPVTSVDLKHTTEEWQDICLGLLGFSPPARCVKPGRLLLSAISDHLASPQALATTAPQRARCIILLLIGGLLMPDTSGSSMAFMYLPLLEDFGTIAHHSWGSAVLATLYSNLCAYSLCKRKDFGGASLLLQLWAWERMPPIAPTPLDASPPQFSHAYRDKWAGRLDRKKTSRHILGVHRDQISSITPDQFHLEPYTTDVLACIPDYCVAGQQIWRASRYGGPARC